MRTREPRPSLKTFCKGRRYENGLVATSRFCCVYTGSCRGRSLRQHRPSTRRSHVHAVSTGSPTASAATIKAFMLSGTRCRAERPRGWCRVLWRKFSPAWSRGIPVLVSCGTNSGTTHSTRRSISSLTRWSSAQSVENGLKIRMDGERRTPDLSAVAAREGQRTLFRQKRQQWIVIAYWSSEAGFELREGVFQ